MKEPNNQWKLDKRLPISVLVILTAHTLGAVWYASALNSRVAALEDLTQNNQEVIGKIIRLETQLQYIQQNTARIEQALTKIADKD
tara:strand:+ start:25120 stop:25377 length:258 start_codon:yes stop_codon:yes gene_type:complete